ncbi:rhomboid family membrane protein-like protein [Diplocarpon rosae]|nr:rhomboid family membrane protein-like protein [Diplocarpon rosae]
MAANEYYNPSSRHQTPRPYHDYDNDNDNDNYASYNPTAQSHSQPPAAPSIAPSYHTESSHLRRHDIASPISPYESPFVAPFDDHVYPAAKTSRFDSQTTLGGDSRHYEQGGDGHFESSSSYQDGIPLREHPAVPPKDAPGAETDHVYDAPVQPAMLEEGKKSKRKRISGMFMNQKKRVPWITYILTAVQVGVFIGEIAKNGSPIQTKPQFNPMIGPSPYVLINMGARFVPCMHSVDSMEEAIGPIRYFLVYFASGIFGFVLGGNFAATGIASTGASGALFGIIALNLLDLFYTWGDRRSPWKDFAFIMLDITISFGLGLLPGLDNFSHIGGFFMGLALGICILHSPNALRKRIGEDDPPYKPVPRAKVGDGNSSGAGIMGFAKNPMGFFKGRKPLWWAWWIVRAGNLVFVLVVFILLLQNFYADRKTCSWCKYLSCIDVNDWCNIGNLQLTTTNG